MKQFYPYRWPLAVGWLLLVSVLFCLPGSAFPQNNWLSRIQFDKIVHVGIFFGLAWTWSLALGLKGFRRSAGMIAVLLVYGMLVEVVQHYFIVNRSFDIGDFVADTGGCLLGVWFWTYIKN
ncbi:MAG TPA: VanZ family protein [Chitinophagaceae bacterium]|jgi:VanZ family protein|nr:VanZ family protein [Chitinophagaceae bacterium]